MPIHNVHAANLPTGSPPDLLQSFGLLLAVEISIPDALSAALSGTATRIPAAVPGSALVDTGASCCCVEECHLQSLGLHPVGQVKMSSPTGEREQNVYIVKLILPGTVIPPVEMQVAGVQMNQGKTICLIERDVLRHCILIYNGPMGSYSHSF